MGWPGLEKSSSCVSADSSLSHLPKPEPCVRIPAQAPQGVAPGPEAGFLFLAHPACPGTKPAAHELTPLMRVGACGHAHRTARFPGFGAWVSAAGLASNISCFDRPLYNAAPRRRMTQPPHRIERLSRPKAACMRMLGRVSTGRKKCLGFDR